MSGGYFIGDICTLLNQTPEMCATEYQPAVSSITIRYKVEQLRKNYFHVSTSYALCCVTRDTPIDEHTCLMKQHVLEASEKP